MRSWRGYSYERAYRIAFQQSNSVIAEAASALLPLIRATSLRPPINRRLPRQLPIAPSEILHRHQNPIGVIRMNKLRNQHRPRPSSEGSHDILAALRPRHTLSKLPASFVPGQKGECLIPQSDRLFGSATSARSCSDRDRSTFGPNIEDHHRLARLRQTPLPIACR